MPFNDVDDDDDDAGNLHLSNVMVEDGLGLETSYVCVVYNPVIRSICQGNDQRIVPTTRHRLRGLIECISRPRR